MSLETLPHDIIFYIATFCKKEYIYEDDNDDYTDDGYFNQLLKDQLLKENGEGCYYPVFQLYTTCTKFGWLSKFEYISVEYVYNKAGFFFANIICRNIKGTPHGMGYSGTIDTGILGYYSYDNGELINENIPLTDNHHYYRSANRVKYHEDPLCKRWIGKCKEDCETCMKFNTIQQQIFAKDPEMKIIFESDYNHGTIIIRKPMPLLQFNYCVKNLKQITLPENKY